MSGSKVTAILLDGGVLPIGGVASGRVCALPLFNPGVLMVSPLCHALHTTLTQSTVDNKRPIMCNIMRQFSQAVNDLNTDNCHTRRKTGKVGRKRTWIYSEQQHIKKWKKSETASRSFYASWRPHLL